MSGMSQLRKISPEWFFTVKCGEWYFVNGIICISVIGVFIGNSKLK